MFARPLLLPLTLILMAICTNLGRWIHLACVYDGPSRRVTHFVDGDPVCSLPIEKETRLRFGRAEIGNWVSTGFIDHTVRSLNGRIDELVLFRTSLAPAEIRELYMQGRP